MQALVVWVKNTVPAGRICALVLLANKCSTTMGDTMESGHIKIYEPHHLGLLKMLSASVLDGIIDEAGEGFHNFCNSV